MEPSSSAHPGELNRYSRAGADVSARALAEARRLEAELAPFFARCTEYRVPAAAGLAARLSSYGNHEAELATWVGEVGRGFERADAGAALDGISPAGIGLAARLATLRWNGEARHLIALTALIRQLLRAGGINTVPLMLPLLLPAGLFSLADIESLSLAGGYEPDSAEAGRSLVTGLFQLLHGFWYEGMAHLEPELFRELSAQIDGLRVDSGVAFILGSGARNDFQAEGVVDLHSGALDVTAAQAFLVSGLCAGTPMLPFRPTPADSLAGDHSAISYFPGEQVRLERLNGAAGDYRISIAGLDPLKPGTPNNFEAVALTAQGVSEGNHYYELVRERFLADLERIPPGSTLHLQGHSMGGGMCFLLRDDPAVRQALVAAGISVGSLITFGAVRPRGAAGQPRDEGAGPFDGAEERHYVNGDDSLARNVGAGHAGAPHVIMLDDERIDEPSAAHTDYDNAGNYLDLPPELRELPYVVDPASYVAYGPAPSQPSTARSPDGAP